MPQEKTSKQVKSYSLPPTIQVLIAKRSRSSEVNHFNSLLTRKAATMRLMITANVTCNKANMLPSAHIGSDYVGQALVE